MLKKTYVLTIVTACLIFSKSAYATQNNAANSLNITKSNNQCNIKKFAKEKKQLDYIVIPDIKINNDIKVKKSSIVIPNFKYESKCSSDTEIPCSSDTKISVEDYSTLPNKNDMQKIYIKKIIKGKNCLNITNKQNKNKNFMQKLRNNKQKQNKTHILSLAKDQQGRWYENPTAKTIETLKEIIKNQNTQKLHEIIQKPENTMLKSILKKIREEIAKNPIRKIPR